MTSPRTTAATTNEPSPASSADTHRNGWAALTLGAIGVVYGDIGTSPLYTVKEVFAPATGVPLNPANLVGAVSCIFWSLMLVVTLKYVILILRADNRGEGGGLALTALAAHAVAGKPALRRALLLLGVFGATLFYGDSVITPAISVLGAMEGLEVATPALKAYVVPVSLAVLLGLFVVQRFGTAAVGRVFGPVITLWFVTLAVTGVMHIAAQPGILAALNPLAAMHFLTAPRLARVRGGGRDRAGTHWRRGAVRRHGALRPAPDPDRVDRARAALAGPELHGPGRAVDGRPGARSRTRSTGCSRRR